MFSHHRWNFEGLCTLRTGYEVLCIYKYLFFCIDVIPTDFFYKDAIFLQKGAIFLMPNPLL